MRLKLSRSTSYLRQPWAIQESATHAILARMEEEDRSFSAIAKEYGTPIDGVWSREIIDGIAIKRRCCGHASRYTIGRQDLFMHQRVPACYRNRATEMLSRIAAAICRFLKSIGTDLWSGRWDIVNWCENVAKMPFRLVFGHGQPQPSYAPEYQTADLLDTLKDARVAANEKVHRLDRNGIESVLEFAKAHRNDRATMPLPKRLDPRVRAALVTMNDAALRTLSKAGIGQVRRFIDGIPHGIPGVPAFGERLPADADAAPPKGMTSHQAMLWKIRAQLLKETNAEPFTAPKVAKL